MKYAVIQTGGKQYKVSEGDVITVERLKVQADDTVTFSDVLLYTADDVVQIGQPHVEGMTVTGKVVANIRGEKLRISKYKAKVRYRRVTGHRQELTQVQIDVIGDAKKAKVDTAKKELKVETKVTKSPVRTVKNKVTEK
ncbi:MAG: large subunit ribosomal protein [Patescibacteria group bacterium]|jgi:large subunit ribosomal protein L21|nr:large subunit ribosomal protein [Patescibacteria group bacterium]